MHNIYQQYLFLKTCKKAAKMNRWESHFTHTHQQHRVLIEEQGFSDLNPIYALADVTWLHKKHTT
jgi:hypothetical protein